MAIITTGSMENRSRDVRSLAVRAANVGTESANVLLEVFRAVPSAEDGLPRKNSMYSVWLPSRPTSCKPLTIFLPIWMP